jgi:hypothetical protein
MLNRVTCVPNGTNVAAQQLYSNFFALHFFFQHGIMITKEEMDARLSEEQEEINQDIMVYLKCF